MKLLRTGGQILTSRVGQAGINAVCGWLVARTLGPAGQGFYSLTLTVAIFIASLFNGGMGLAAVPPLRAGQVGLGKMLSAQRRWIGLTVGALILVAVAAWAGGLSGITARYLGWDPLVAAGAVLAAAALLAFDIFFYDLLAIGRLLAGPLVNLGRSALHLLALCAFLLAGGLGLRSAVFAYGGAQAVAAAVAFFLLMREAVRRRPVEIETIPAVATGDLMISTLRKGWVGQLSAVVSLLHLRLDLAIVVAWHGAAEVGVYSVAVLIGEVLWLLPGALQPLLVYSASGRDADAAGGGGQAARDEDSARAVRVGLAATAAAALVLGFIARPLFDLLLPVEFSRSVPALRALLPGIVALAAGAVLAGDFIGRGVPAWNTRASGVTVVVNVGAGLLLIPAHGAVGAAWASTIAYVVGAAVMVARFRSVSGLPLSRILLTRAGDFRKS